MSSRRGESVLTEQTIETKKNLPHKRKKILVEACATICRHSTVQQRWEMRCLFMKLMAKKKNEKQSNLSQRKCLTKRKNDCLKWLSMKQNNIWHRPTLALIGRRGLNYGKKDELDGRPDRRNRILVFLPYSKGGV
jgi:hypothetical protein